MIALVPQRPMIPPESTVLDYVNLGRTPHLSYLAVEGAADVAAVWSAISRLDLESLAHRRLGSLSGGEMQRAVLARALAQEPSILLLDEPTAALDLGHQQQVLGLVEELRRTGNLTVVSALHDLTMAARFCDQLVLLNGGRVMALGAAGDVLTEESIRRHYGADVRVLTLDEGGVAVIPIGPLGATAGKAMRV
jgi:iron complex transport system ATP-binding protein